MSSSDGDSVLDTKGRRDIQERREGGREDQEGCIVELSSWKTGLPTAIESHYCVFKESSHS